MNIYVGDIAFLYLSWLVEEYLASVLRGLQEYLKVSLNSTLRYCLIMLGHLRYSRNRTKLEVSVLIL